MLKFIPLALILLLAIGVIFYILMRNDHRPALTKAEKRVIRYYLTKGAEAARVDSQALQQVGFDQPAVIDRASDLKALAEKVMKL